MKRRLIKWINGKTRRQHAARSVGWRRFHGQIEPLEARTVLSAAIGGMPADFESGVTGSWEIAYYEPGRPVRAPSISLVSQNVDRPLSLAARSPHDERGPFDHVDRGSGPLAAAALPGQGPLYLVLEITIIRPGSMPWSGEVQPPEPPVPQVSTTSSAPLRSTSPFTNPPDDPQTQSRAMAQSSVAPLGAALGLLATQYETPQGGSSMRATPTSARDAAFQDYSFGTLLLTVGVDGSPEDQFDGLDEDSWAFVLSDEKETATLDEIGLND